jgi:hypothetical protein
MKRIEDIETMSLEELEQASAGIPVPEGLSGRIESALAAEKLSRKSTGRLLGTSIAATLAAAAVATVLILQRPAPKDSFEDPLLAYQQVEETLQFIAQKINKVYE